eukprot:TRINITY_DN7919_c0_g2_i1.p1 TRINITY_DN7919_c0_g2~~TRINITY_DN7919_c0_g2_i1.p1  ORF type:complete len:444 (+),score=110.80 TRINITY_DN7919_c0_g2_i1:54-1385(+)
MFDCTGIAWGDAGLLTMAGDDCDGDDLNVANLQCMLKRGPSEQLGAKRILTMWLDLNRDDTERLSRVLCPEHVSTVMELLSLPDENGPCTPPGSPLPRLRKVARLRQVPGATLPPAAQTEAEFLLRMRTMQLDLGLQYPQLFGDSVYAQPSRGPAAEITAASMLRLIEGLVEDGQYLQHVAAVLEAGCADPAAAREAVAFVVELMRLARTCGAAAAPLHAELHSAAVLQHLTALLTTPLRAQACEALRAAACCHAALLAAARMAVAARPDALRALAAQCRTGPSAEAELLTVLLGFDARSDAAQAFARAFATVALPTLADTCQETPSEAAFRMGAAWLRHPASGPCSHAARLLKSGIRAVAAVAKPSGDAAPSFSVAYEVLVFAKLAARKCVVGWDDRALRVHAEAMVAGVPGARVVREGMLHQAAEHFCRECIEAVQQAAAQ